MTEGERLIWAATYATRWSQALEKKEILNISTCRESCAEEACAAVLDLRDMRDEIVRGWGEDSAELAMIDEMLS